MSIEVEYFHYARLHFSGQAEPDAYEAFYLQMIPKGIGFCLRKDIPYEWAQNFAAKAFDWSWERTLRENSDFKRWQNGFYDKMKTEIRTHYRRTARQVDSVQGSEEGERDLIAEYAEDTPKDVATDFLVWARGSTCGHCRYPDTCLLLKYHRADAATEDKLTKERFAETEGIPFSNFKRYTAACRTALAELYVEYTNTDEDVLTNRRLVKQALEAKVISSCDECRFPQSCLLGKYFGPGIVTPSPAEIAQREKMDVTAYVSRIKHCQPRLRAACPKGSS